jgi:phage terminase large subunit-like protein
MKNVPGIERHNASEAHHYLFFSSILLWSVMNTITIYNNAYTDIDDKQWATIVTTTTTTTTIVMKLRMAKTPHRWVVAMELVKQ